MPTTAHLAQRCQRVANKLLEAYAWGLLTEDELARRMVARVETTGEPQEAELKILAWQEYALALYQACGFEATSDQQQAYSDLGRYLYKHARYWRTGWEEANLQDAAQQALVDIYEKRQAQQVHEPKSFLAFALSRLRGAITQVSRRQKLGGQPLASWDELTGGAAEGETPGDWEPTLLEHSALLPERASEEAELRQAIVAELRRKYQIHPDAEQQLNATLLKHMLNYSNEAVARQLKIASQANVDMLIFRGKKKLRQNRELEELYLQWLEAQPPTHSR